MKAAVHMLAVLCLCASSSVHAAVPDYDTKSDEWNGLSYLLTTAMEAKVHLEVVRRLDMSTLKPGDVLLSVYPLTPLPETQLLRFVRDGGAFIVADDYGSSAALLDRVGIVRTPGVPANHAQRIEAKAYLPIFLPKEKHFLFFNMDRVVANHPAHLKGIGNPILSYDGGTQHLVMERRWGRGSILAIADGSVLLNEMLKRHYGNKQFAANALRIYCAEEPCRVKLLTSNVTFTGEYLNHTGAIAELAALFNEAGTFLNQTIKEADRYTARPPMDQVLLLFVGILAFVWALLMLARGRRRVIVPLSGAVQGVVVPAAWQSIAMSRGRQDADFLQLAQVVLGRALASQCEKPIDRPGEMPEAVAHALSRLNGTAEEFEQRLPPHVSAEHFMTVYADAWTVLRHASDFPEQSIRDSAAALR
jgi:hypothetical protein